MGLLAGGTVIFGLGKIVDVIGKIGPAIVILTIMLGIVAIIMNPSGLATANSIIPQLNLLKASTNWFFSAVSYVGIILFIFMAYKTIRQRILKSNITPQDQLS